MGNGKKVALVLSGGGARGAFQFAAADHLYQAGYRWNLIAGVSVGALNGVMLAMDKREELRHIWETITPGQVYTGWLNRVYAALRLILGKSSVLGNKPLERMLERYVDVDRITIDLRVGVVSLMTGQYAAISRGDLAPEAFVQAVLASTVMPIVWPPVTISKESPDLTSLVDGGVRNVSPLGDVLDADPDEVVVINCDADDPPVLEKPPTTILDIALRALTEITINEIFRSDLHEFLRINDLIRQAGQQGVTLYKDEKQGVPYKHFQALVIQPDAPLDEVLDFSREAIARSMAAGYRKAREVLGR